MLAFPITSHQSLHVCFSCRSVVCESQVMKKEMQLQSRHSLSVTSMKLPAMDMYPRIMKLIFDEWQEIWSVSSALRELHWLPIKQRIKFKLCLLVHKSLIGHSPAYISDMLTSAADVPGRPALRTASRGDFIVQRTNRTFRDRAFCVAAPRVWNRLPADLRQLRSTQTFRRHLKTFLFAASY